MNDFYSSVSILGGGV